MSAIGGLNQAFFPQSFDVEIFTFFLYSEPWGKTSGLLGIGARLKIERGFVMGYLSLAMARTRGLSPCLLALLAAMPIAAQAHPDLSISAAPQDDLITVAGRSGASSLHHRLQVGAADVTQAIGPLSFGVALQYGTVVKTDLNDYAVYESDHRSLRIRREAFAGGTASLGLYKGWRLKATGGRVQMQMHDGLGDMARRRTLNEGTLGGWRMTAGLQHALGDGLVTVGWQRSRFAGRRCADPGQPTRGSAGHVGLEINAPL